MRFVVSRSVIFCTTLLFSCVAAASQFPLRSVYKSVATIEHDELAKNLDKLLVVDVRSNFEFRTLRIRGAVNISMSNAGFINKLVARLERLNQPIVFYCNGITCAKSYQASLKAIRHNIENVRTFDLGVLGWAQRYPKQSMLLGNIMQSADELIGDQALLAHSLAAKEFEAKIDKQSMLLDIRDPVQREVVIFQGIARETPLDRVETALKRARKTGKLPLMFDAVGKQVRWLQYHLEDAGFEEYYFLQGGVKAYAEEVMDYPSTSNKVIERSVEVLN